MIDEVANIEKVEADLNRFIERRAAQNEKVNAEELMWKASARRHAARLREERLWDRLGYHRAMLDAHTRTFERLIRRHTSDLRLCEEALGITNDKQHDEGDAA